MGFHPEFPLLLGLLFAELAPGAEPVPRRLFRSSSEFDEAFLGMDLSPEALLVWLRLFELPWLILLLEFDVRSSPVDANDPPRKVLVDEIAVCWSALMWSDPDETSAISPSSILREKRSQKGERC